VTKMGKFKVLITSHSFGKEGNEAFDILNEAGVDYILEHKSKLWTEEEIICYSKDVDGIIVGADSITRNIIDNSKNLKIIAKHGVGFDNIDMEAAKERGLLVTIGVGSNSIAVAEMAVTLMMNLARNINLCNNETKKGQWKRKIGVELKGKTIGLVGLGKIGKETAKRVLGFDTKVIAYDPFPDNDFAQKYNIDFVEINELLKQSDFISLHLPLMKSTKNLINKDNLKYVKPTAFIVNTSRGGIINENDLYEFLKCNKIAGAAIDAFQNEPPAGNPLLDLENVIATPHLGAYTHDAVNNMSVMSAQAIADFIKGKEPYYLVKM
jgi:D-3-phosphoglycerate dehydrogenase